MSLALVRIETGLEVESLLADVTLERLVKLRLTAPMRLPHVGREVEDGAQHEAAQLAFKADRSLWRRSPDNRIQLHLLGQRIRAQIGKYPADSPLTGKHVAFDVFKFLSRPGAVCPD